MATSDNIWIEVTGREHGRGGPGWECGSLLWSPSRDRGGVDRYHLMRQVAPGDRVLHFFRDSWGEGATETRVVGESRVRGGYREVSDAPPRTGEWSDRAPYYKVELTGYTPFSAPIRVQQLTRDYRDAIRRELTVREPKHYPFSLRGLGTPDEELRTNRGMYIAVCTSHLYLIIRDALAINESDVMAPLGGSVHEDYSEARRSLDERRHFIKHHALAREVATQRGYNCDVCGFNFEEAYGAIGADYIDFHQPPSASNEVIIVCANCHRMMHRRDPPLDVDALRGRLRRD